MSWQTLEKTKDVSTKVTFECWLFHFSAIHELFQVFFHFSQQSE